MYLDILAHTLVIIDGSTCDECDDDILCSVYIYCMRYLNLIKNMIVMRYLK